MALALTGRSAAVAWPATVTTAAGPRMRPLISFMRVSPRISGISDGSSMQAMLAENYPGFDDQALLELLSQIMWRLRNANRRFGGDAEHGWRPNHSAGKPARPTMPL